LVILQEVIFNLIGIDTSFVAKLTFGSTADGKLKSGRYNQILKASCRRGLSRIMFPAVIPPTRLYIHYRRVLLERLFSARAINVCKTF